MLVSCVMEQGKEKFVEAIQKKLDALFEEKIENISEKIQHLPETEKESHRKVAETIRKTGKLDWVKFDSVWAEVVGAWAAILAFGKANVSYKFESHAFPDVTVKTDNLGKIGLEIKFRAEGKTTLGNSSLQANPGVAEIFALCFYSKKVGADIQYDIHLYENLITGIVVDHNPRFALSLDGTGKKQNLFGCEGLLGDSLVDFFEKDKNTRHQVVGEVVRSALTPEDCVWYAGENDGDEIKSTIADIFEKVVDAWFDLDKDALKTEVFAKHLEILSPPQKDWAAARRWLLKEKMAVGSIKDVFTAGGISGENGIGLSALFYNFSTQLDKVKERLSPEELGDWKTKAKAWIDAVPEGGSLTPDGKNFLKAKVDAL